MSFLPEQTAQPDAPPTATPISSGRLALTLARIPPPAVVFLAIANVAVGKLRLRFLGMEPDGVIGMVGTIDHRGLAPRAVNRRGR
jgi:hypothetical protein